MKGFNDGSKKILTNKFLNKGKKVFRPLSYSK
jgi:hypothetical protein